MPATPLRAPSIPPLLSALPAPPAWRITDPVVRLRALETGALFPLPPPRARATAAVGTLAFATWQRGRWHLRALPGGPPLRVFGGPCRAAALSAGAEVTAGDTTLLAESAGLLSLRALAARLLGGPSDPHTIDRALRALRDAALRRASLILCGDGDLTPIALRLHRELCGPDLSFVACGPRDRALPLLRLAGPGTLCLDALSPPADAAAALSALRRGAAPARLTLCAPDPLLAAPLAAHLSAAVWLELPSLISHRAELPRLLVEAAADAASLLSQPSAPLRTGDIERLSAEPFIGHADLHDAAHRLVALRSLGLTAAAAHLGTPPAALARWARRRGLA